MKRILAIVLATFMVLSLCACANNKTTCNNCNSSISNKAKYCEHCRTKIINTGANENAAIATVLVVREDDNETTIDTSNINKDIDLAKTCIEIFETNSLLETVRYKLDFAISLSEFKETIQISLASPESSIIKIVVSTETKEKSDKILSLLLDEYSNKVPSIFNGSKLSIIDKK